MTAQRHQFQDRPTSHGALSAEELAVRARARGAAGMAAYSELVERFNGRLYSFLTRRLSPADAEDVTQEAFLRAWQRIETYDSRYRFSTWLFTIAQRLAISHGRSSAAKRGQRLGLQEEPLHQPAANMNRHEDRARIWGLVEKILGEEQQTAMWLRYVEEMAIGDIARVMGRTQVSVRVMLFRARTMLAQRLEQTDDGVSEITIETKQEPTARRLRPVEYGGGAA